VRRTMWGAATALVALAACTGVLLAFRPHLSLATSALVLVVPVVLGVTVGGFAVGAGAAILGFLVYDWFFIPPYGTLSVSSAQDWVALGVYLAVVLVVSRLVAVQQDARRVATDREDAVRRLFVVSEQMIGERSLDELLALVVTTVHDTFPTTWVAALLPDDGQLSIVATAGRALTDEDRDEAVGTVGSTQALTLVGARTPVSRVALTARQRPVGQLVVAGASLDRFERQLLGAFANQAALAIERSQLRAKALRTELLEEVDRWRSALVGAVSHDLRTPLASIKAAVSTLRGEVSSIPAEDRRVLLETIEDQCDHLTRLVANLLDMARLEAGTLTLRSEPQAVADIVDAAVVAVGHALGGHTLDVRIDRDLPLVEADLVLISQVLANLLTNASQHSPDVSVITISACQVGREVAMTVSDEGPGVPEQDRERIFHMLDRNAGSGRAGLGLAISTAFVEAHGRRITVADAPGGGASFTFQLPAAVLDEEPA
jgi:two-component system, OmpR family, sensor histidine kinase KdpD